MIRSGKNVRGERLSNTRTAGMNNEGRTETATNAPTCVGAFVAKKNPVASSCATQLRLLVGRVRGVRDVRRMLVYAVDVRRRWRLRLERRMRLVRMLRRQRRHRVQRRVRLVRVQRNFRV